MRYEHQYLDVNTYQVEGYFDDGSRHVPVEDPGYLAWKAAGVPMVKVIGKYLIIENGVVVADPNKAAIIAGEESAARDRSAKAILKDIDLKSIRSIREYIATKEDAPTILKIMRLKQLRKGLNLGSR
jgi:hypothetical protein